MGNIGVPLKEVEFEPVPDTVPVPETVPETVPERVLTVSETMPERVLAGMLERIASLPNATIVVNGYFE